MQHTADPQRTKSGPPARGPCQHCLSGLPLAFPGPWTHAQPCRCPSLVLQVPQQAPETCTSHSPLSPHEHPLSPSRPLLTGLDPLPAPALSPSTRSASPSTPFSPPAPLGPTLVHIALFPQVLTPLGAFPSPRRGDQEGAVLGRAPGHPPGDTFAGAGCRQAASCLPVTAVVLKAQDGSHNLRVTTAYPT